MINNPEVLQEPKVVKKCTICRRYILDEPSTTILNGYPICKDCCSKALKNGLNLLSYFKK